MNLPDAWAGTLFLLMMALLAGCERPFVDLSPPSIEVVSPDPAVVQEQAEISLILRASSFRSVSRVELGGMSFQETPSGDWSLPVTLRPGMNRLIVEAFDAEETAGQDTVHFLLSPAQSQVASSRWIDARGAHTATPLPLGDIVIAGGSGSTTSDASSHLSVLPVGATEIRRSDVDLSFARLGHTASMLPDGRILFAGGARVPLVTSVQDLVETPEIYHPVTGSITQLVVQGDPIRRAFHTATVSGTPQNTVISLLGGTGDIAYTPRPELGIRRDIRSFQLVGDTLKALSPAVGPFIELLTGHSQTDLAHQPPGTLSRQLITGAIFTALGSETHAFVLDPRSPLGITFETIRPPSVHRTEHTAVLIAPGRVFRAGGMASLDGVPLASADVFVDAIGGFLSYHGDGQLNLRPRHLQTATNLGNGRILLLGGFDETGTAIETMEFVVFDL